MSGSEGMMQPRTQGMIVHLTLELFHKEIRSTANEEEEQQFLRAVGAGLAHRFPIVANGGVSMLENDLNLIFSELGLGSSHISVTEDGLRILHRFDCVEMDREPVLRAVLPAMLEGAYDAWLRTLGSGPQLRTILIALADDGIELRHGL